MQSAQDINGYETDLLMTLGKWILLMLWVDIKCVCKILFDMYLKQRFQ